MKHLFLLVTALSCVLISCNTNNGNEEFSNATVVENESACGRFLIRFDDKVTGLPKNAYSLDNICHPLNLPEACKTEGKRISVKFREPHNDEFVICNDFGPSYPQIWLLEVK